MTAGLRYKRMPNHQYPPPIQSSPLPVLSVVNDASDFLESVRVVPVNEILAVIISATEKIPQATVSQVCHCANNQQRSGNGYKLAMPMRSE